MESPVEQDCPHCNRRSKIMDGQRCQQCGALVCDRCDERIAEIDELLSKDGSEHRPQERSEG